MVDATALQLAQRENITSMPLRPSGTGVLMLDGESVCISSAQGDDAESHSTDAKFWCGINSGEVATVRSVLCAHDKFGCFSMYSAPRAKRCPAELLSSCCILCSCSTAMAMSRERERRENFQTCWEKKTFFIFPISFFFISFSAVDEDALEYGFCV